MGAEQAVSPISLPAQSLADAEGRMLLAVNGLELAAGEVLAVTGRSGAGKSLWLKSLFGWAFPGQSATLSPRLGDGLLVQDPGRGLTPTLTIGAMVRDLDRTPGWAERALTRFRELGLNSDRLLERKPATFSGGERQRLLLGLLLMRNPRVLACDEPAASLDEQSEKLLWKMLGEQRLKRGATLIFVTHRLSLIEAYADRVLILEQGRTAFLGSTAEFFAEASHPTQAALTAFHRRRNPIEMEHASESQRSPIALAPKTTAPAPAPALQVRALGLVRDRRELFGGLDWKLREGDWWWVTGASGCGKTSLLRILAGLISVERGQLEWRGQSLPSIWSERSPELRREIGFLFQHGSASFNPARTLEDQLQTAFANQGPAAKQRLAQELADLELNGLQLNRKPDAYSQGQLQRLSLVRLLATQPSLLLCDEPTSSLDAIGKHQLLNRLLRYREQQRATVIFVTHDEALLSRLPAPRLVFRPDAFPVAIEEPPDPGLGNQTALI